MAPGPSTGTGARTEMRVTVEHDQAKGVAPAKRCAPKPPDQNEAYEELAERLTASLKRIEVTADEWGVRPEHLEGKFVIAQLHALRTLGDIVLETDKAFGTSVTRIDKWIDEVRRDGALQKLILEHQVEELKLQQQAVVTQTIKEMADQITTEIKNTMVIRQVIWNRTRNWMTAAGCASAMIGLVLVGYIMARIQVSNQVTGTETCQRAPLAITSGKASFLACRLSDFVGKDTVQDEEHKFLPGKK